MLLRLRVQLDHHVLQRPWGHGSTDHLPDRLPDNLPYRPDVAPPQVPGAEPGERGPNPDRDRDRDGDTHPFSAARLLQAATPFGAEAATSLPAAAVALAVAASKCYLLTPDGTLSEVLAP